MATDPFAGLDVIWGAVPGVRTVSFYGYNPATDQQSVFSASVQGYQRGRSRREVPAGDGGRAFEEVCVWHLRRSQLKSFGLTVVRRSEVVDANGEVWAVLGEIVLPATGVRVRCDCRLVGQIAAGG